jgi:glycine betaine/proline transport system ATP-binding protein
VFTAEYVMEEPNALRLDRDTPKKALEVMKRLHRNGLYVLRNGEIAGVVTYADVAERSQGNGGGLSALVQGEYPTVEPGRFLYEVYDECTSGLPIAVIDENDRLRGVVDPLHVFAKLTADDDDTAAAAASAIRAGQRDGQEARQ